MKVRNVKVPEGINVSRYKPVADLFVLSAGAIGLFAAVGLLALLIGTYGGRYMPMSWENALAEAVFEGEEIEEATGDDEEIAAAARDDEEIAAAARDDKEIAAALQAIADRLAANIDLPEDLRITVHYLDEPDINAFATLGGHVFVLRGLIERVAHENALAMVMAHEIAHAANRDVAANMGGALLLQLVLGTVTGMSPETVDGLIWGPNALLLRSFSREAERAADRDGLAAVAETYGHVAGADAFFRVMLAEIGETLPEQGPEFLSTHPLTEKRIKELGMLAEARNWAAEGEMTPLKEALTGLVAAE
jgi:predicted Zn-dependent protease